VFPIGLTGLIGTGKSAVADLLVAHGAALIDADRIAATVRAPGGLAYAPLIERFGVGILADDGTIDRPALAKAAFVDEVSIADLNRITHPAINEEILRQLEALADTDRIVVVDIPLLRPVHRENFQLQAVVVVDSPPEVAMERLVGRRGMDPADAAARMGAQLTREARLEGADFVVDNSSDLDHLAAEVDRLWRWLQETKSAVDG
jgi:dephospho-CoA kinase